MKKILLYLEIITISLFYFIINVYLKNNLTIYNAVIINIFIIIIILLYYFKRFSINIFDHINLNVVKSGVMIGGCYSFIIYLINYIFFNRTIKLSFDALYVIFLFASACSEELFFRCLIYKYIKYLCSIDIISNLIISFCFANLHYYFNHDYIQFIFSFLFSSFLLIIIKVKKDYNVISMILIHFIYNVVFFVF